MNDAQILTHAAFDRPPVLNARRRGPTPRGIPMLRRERFERTCAKQKAEREARLALTPEEKLAEYNEAVNEMARGLLMAVRAFNALRKRLDDELSHD